MDLITIFMWLVIGAAVGWFLEWWLMDLPTRAAVTRRFEEELTAARNETEKIRIDLRDARDRSISLEREVGDVRAVLKAEADVRATAETKLLASDKKAVDLTAELARTRSELQAMTTRAAIIPSLESSVAEWEQKHQAEAQARATTAQQAKDQEARLRAQLGDWEARHKAEAGARAAADEKSLGLTDELDALRAELMGATQKVALIPTLQTSAADWEERYRREAQAREHAELKTGEINAQLDRLRAQVGDWEARFKVEATARAAAESRTGGLSGEIEQLRAQIGTLQQQQQDAFSATDQQAGVLSTEITRLQAQSEGWEGRYKAEAHARLEADQLHAQITVLQQQQQDAFAAADQQAGGLSLEIDKLRAQLDEWRGRFAMEAEMRRIAEARAEDLAVELESARGELTTVHERVAVIPTLQASATDWESKFQAEIAQRARYQQEIQAYEEELAQRGTQVSTLETQHRAAVEAQTAAEGRATTAEAERDGLREQLAAWENRLSGESSARIEADQNANALKAELDKLRSEVGSLSKRVTLIPTLESSATSWEQRYQNEVGLRTQLDGTVRERDTEITLLRERLAALEAEHSSRTAALQSQLELFGTPAKADNLEVINGIGKVFARKLSAAGVLTFEDLARTPVDRIREIIQPKAWQKIEPEAWVLEAAGRAGRPVGFSATPSRADDLVAINGIGEVYARKLNEAGITTFADLAAATPERLREILNPEEWQKFEPEAWMAEAAEFARRGQ